MAILIVEDDEVLGQAILESLNEAGYQLEWAKSGEEAFTLLDKAKYDLILLDIRLPGIDGYEVLKRLKADTATQKIKVVMLTNLGQMSEINRAMELGALDYVIKANIDVSRLPQLVKNKYLKG